MLPLRVLALTRNDVTEGCTFARIDTPLRVLQASGAIEYRLVNVLLRRPAFLWRLLSGLRNWDVVWIQRPYHYTVLPFIRLARRLGKPVLIDIDDWLLDLPPESSDAAFFGTCTARETMRLALKSATALTVSTGLLAERYAALGPPVHVLPNAIDVKQFVSLSRDSATITIAFCGTPSHRDDVALVMPGLREVLLTSGGRVRVVSVGCPLPPLQGLLGYTHYELVAAPEYPRVLSDLRIDIGLAPLLDTPFNQAKSDIKHLEYSAVGAVTLASPVLPYQDIMQKDRGMLVNANTPEAWSTAIRRLLDEPRLRQRLAQNAYEWVHRERSVEATANTWLAVFDAYRGSYMSQASSIDDTLFARAMMSIVLRQFPVEVWQVSSALVRQALGRAYPRGEADTTQ